MKNFLDDRSTAYDALAKRVLSRKAILAQILKFSVKEFSDCTLEDIEQKYIEGDPTLAINTVPLDDTFTSKDETRSRKVRRKVLSLSILFSMRLCRWTEKKQNL